MARSKMEGVAARRLHPHARSKRGARSRLPSFYAENSGSLPFLPLWVFRISRINLARRHEATTFWSRHAEFIKITVAAILGGFATALGERLMRALVTSVPNWDA